MADVVPFRKPKASEKHRGKTLCRHGFHRWQAEATPFDVRRGKLITCERCSRCGATRTKGR